MVLKRFNGLVDELAVRRGVPFEPVACVAVETVALKHRWLVGIVGVVGVAVVTVLVVVIWGFLWWFSLGILGDWRWGCGFHGAGNHVSKDFTVFKRKNRS